MTHPAWLEPADFAAVIRLAPLVSIDLILRDPDGHALLGWRANRPARDNWFVPGGRIGKNEKLADAFARILKGETGLEHPYSEARLLGVYEHFYADNHLGLPEFGTHYVVVGTELRLPTRPAIVSDEQHSRMRWMAPTDILEAPDVHENTKAYFR